ncbi:MAG TPA: glutaredoxin family protein, partial [Minicystis sp.]|nr:glutaredoxin family protein [Minicystis sp.]
GGVKTLVFYTRARCHLCDEAKAAVLRVRARAPFELVLVDLDREASAEKLAAYTYEVPVGELDGRKVFKYRVDEARLERLVREGVVEKGEA